MTSVAYITDFGWQWWRAGEGSALSIFESPITLYLNESKRPSVRGSNAEKSCGEGGSAVIYVIVD